MKKILKNLEQVYYDLIIKYIKDSSGSILIIRKRPFITMLRDELRAIAAKAFEWESTNISGTPRNTTVYIKDVASPLKSSASSFLPHILITFRKEKDSSTVPLYTARLNYRTDLENMEDGEIALVTFSAQTQNMAATQDITEANDIDGLVQKIVDAAYKEVVPKERPPPAIEQRKTQEDINRELEEANPGYKINIHTGKLEKVPRRGAARGQPRGKPFRRGDTMNWSDILKTVKEGEGPGKKHYRDISNLDEEGKKIIPFKRKFSGKKRATEEGPNFEESLDEKGEYQPLPEKIRSTHIEDYGETEKTKDNLANWFQTIDALFEQMLDRIGISYSGAAQPIGFERIEHRVSYNRKMVKRLGLDIATTLLNAATEGFFKIQLEDDDANTIIETLSSPEYTKMVDIVQDSLEGMFSKIFDEVYHSVRYKFDTEYNVDEEIMEVPADEKIPDTVVDMIWNELESAVTDFIQETLAIIGASELPDAIKDNMESALAASVSEGGQPSIKSLLKEWTAYIYQSFAIKYPEEQSKLSGREDVDPDEFPITQEGVDPYEGEEGREDSFSDFYASEQHGKYTGEHDWRSTLQKEPTLTTSKGFAPNLHNVTFSEPCNCKKKGCRCDE